MQLSNHPHADPLSLQLPQHPGLLQIAGQPTSSGPGGFSCQLGNVRSDSSIKGRAGASTRPKTAGIAPALELCSSCGNGFSPRSRFMRALGTPYHMQCLRCKDCGVNVMDKFFPIDGIEGARYTLCERDYFRRLDLICTNCDMPLRGKYITACNKKYHVEHFTCSVCPFQVTDSYYEHEENVYCQYHYSTRFAAKCAGCHTAILKQFVDLDQKTWHPECYMIMVHWRVMLVLQRSAMPPCSGDCEVHKEEPQWEEELYETPDSLKEKQTRMKQLYERVWTALAGYEDAVAHCICDFLKHFNLGQDLEANELAGEFVTFVEALFAAINDMDDEFARLGVKGMGMSHVREARGLARVIVDLHACLLRYSDGGSGDMTRSELVGLINALSDSFKILVRIALIGSLKLEQEQSNQGAVMSFLDKLPVLSVQNEEESAMA